ncbi:MAG: RNB domain-containing ribonuclease, partial [Beijerinckiaceae bacterium]
MAALTKKGERPRKAGERPELSQAAVLEYLAEHGNDGNKRDLAKYFGLKGNARLALKTILKDIENDGLVERTRGGRFRAPGHLPSVMLCDITERDEDGELIAAPTEWPDDDAPRIAIIRPAKPKIGEPVPGIGDRVLVRLDDTSPEQEQITGRVIKVIGKRARQTLGVFRALPDGSGRLVPVDKKSLGRELVIPSAFTNEAKDGDLVAVSIGKEARLGPPQARVLEKLGSLNSEKAISLVAIHTHGIPHQFPANVIAEAENAKPATLAGREDWRHLPLVTIDPSDAKDHDDAVYAHADDDEKNPGGFVVVVAIADVAAYVRPGTPLDREALLRGNSVYFPDRVVPMLPEKISNDLCSLRENEDRPALAVKIILDKSGTKKFHSFHRIMMRSRAKLAYEQAQAAIDGRPDE